MSIKDNIFRLAYLYDCLDANQQMLTYSKEKISREMTKLSEQEAKITEITKEIETLEKEFTSQYSKIITKWEDLC